MAAAARSRAHRSSSSRTRSGSGSSRRRRADVRIATCSDRSTRRSSSTPTGPRSSSPGGFCHWIRLPRWGMGMDDELNLTIERIAPLDEAAMRATEQELDRKTKPRAASGGSSGSRRSTPASAATPLRRRSCPPSSWPQPTTGTRMRASARTRRVTAQMVRTFAAGGAAICVLARGQAPGSSSSMPASASRSLPAVRSVRIGGGTANAAVGPAMSREQALRAIAAGIGLARELAADGVTACARRHGHREHDGGLRPARLLLGVEPVRVCGPGTGLAAEGPGEDLRGRACARSEPTERRRSGRHRCRPRRLRDRAAERGDRRRFGAAGDRPRRFIVGAAALVALGLPRRPAPT